jgi:hypothetical protein
VGVVRGIIATGCWIGLLAQPVLGQQPCPPGQHAPLVLQGVTPEGDLTLSDGRLVQPAGIRLPDEPRLREPSLAWLRQQVGRPLTIKQAYALDRWQRTPVQLSFGDRPGCPDVAEGLVAEGLALVDPGPHGLVSRALPGLERDAREQHLGLWADARYKDLPVGPIDQMRPWIGRFVLVAGRIRSIGERREQTYLNFGLDWASDFTIVVPKRVWKAMAARGHTTAALKGRLIRARGVLEEWQGPALTVTEPEMIEALENERARR